MYDSRHMRWEVVLKLRLDLHLNRSTRDPEPQDSESMDPENLPANSNLALEDNLLPRKSASESFEDSFSEFSDIVTHRNFTLNEFPDHQEDYHCLAKGVELPHSILCRPWTEETIQYLFWVMNAGGTLNWTTSTTGEASTIETRVRIIGINKHSDCLARLQRSSY